jgi:hypothetical protein
MADNDFGPVLGVNDNDEAMDGVYDAAAAEVDDFMFCSLNGDERDEIEGVGDEMLAPLKSIFDHPLITKVHVEDNGQQVPAWRCGFCAPYAEGLLNNIFKSTPNATKTLKHVTRTPGQVRPCNGTIPSATMQQFRRPSLKDRPSRTKGQQTGRLYQCRSMMPRSGCFKSWQIWGGVNKC